MAHKLLHTHTLSGCRLETVEGSEVISRHRLFSQLLTAELGAEQSATLAEPVKNIEFDRINWYTSLPGEVRPFAELSADEQNFALNTLRTRAAEFTALSERFMSSGATNRNLAGALLSRIFNRPEELIMYLVGDQLVVAGWGMVDNKATVTQVNMMEDSHQDNYTPAIKPLPKASPVPIIAAAPVGSGCLKTFLYLLLGLLLGLGLAFLLLYFVLPALWDNIKTWFNAPSLDIPAFDFNVDQEAKIGRAHV